jgi:Icc-related predicted phosphoesterase/uncharacterized protein YprB with RNaseH-like and TPR domain
LVILACSDLRAQRVEDLIRHVTRCNPRPDLIVYAGDDVGRFRADPTRNDFERLAGLVRFGLVAVIGNDDGPNGQRHLTGKNVYDVHRVNVRIGDVVIMGQEGAPTSAECPGIGAPLYLEEQIARHLRDRAANARPCDRIIVISHAPPHNILDRSFRFGDAHIGSKALATFMMEDLRVRLVVCGHAHVNGGRAERVGHTDVMNVASLDHPDTPIRLGFYRLPHCQTLVSAPPTFENAAPFGELSQIHSIYRSHCEALCAAGVETVRQLAETSPDRIGEIIGWPAKTAARYSFLARARHLGLPIAIAPLLGPRAPRVFFDIESDSGGGRHLCWCIGLMDEANGAFRQFVARNKGHERRMLEEFLDWCSTAKPERLVAYSGADCDRQRLIHRLQAHQLPVPRALEESVDLYTPVTKALAAPVSKYQLKPLAEALGFSFRHSNLGGLGVALRYEAAAKEGEPIPSELLEYNEDDVKATAHVLAVVERICGYGGPATLPRRRRDSLPV